MKECCHVAPKVVGVALVVVLPGYSWLVASQRSTGRIHIFLWIGNLSFADFMLFYQSKIRSTTHSTIQCFLCFIQKLCAATLIHFVCGWADPLARPERIFIDPEKTKSHTALL